MCSYNKLFILFTVAPLAPEIDILTKSRTNSYEIDQKFVAKCISRDGRPPSVISWFLDDEPINDNLGLVEIVDTLTSGNTTLYTSSQTITKYIKSTDDRRNLICRTSHIAGNPQEARLQLQVRCKYTNFA